jgi:hypothetical protein
MRWRASSPASLLSFLTFSLSLRELLAQHALVGGLQEIGARCDEQLLQPLVQGLALLHAQAHLRVERLEALVERGQRVVVVAACATR